ncbi:substrate-binding domain-containing protein [Pumilibacter intestinalis]|uniref:GntR family transcriptional regulator n=1 Tax=Pumilibacter intestinalis TaxID=2941511 RepID=UPI00203A6B96|nr:GntR family transcriptional regulator [Pumilibacter intestinalis]
MSDPLYKVISDNIEELIEKNRNIKNFMLPSENMLALKFNASRVTVRKALADLEQKGTIYKIHGKGTFASPQAETTVTENPQSTLFAFICPNISDDFPRNIYNGINAFCLENNIELLTFCTGGRTSREEAAINLSKRMNCKGILIMPTDEDNYNNGILALTLNKFPTVLIDRILMGLNLPCVSSDHYQIGYKSAEYLAARHQNVCMISLNDIVSSIRSRIEGFKKGLADRKIYHSHILRFAAGSTPSEMLQYFSERPNITGIVCNSGQIYYQLIQAMKKLGKEINRDYEVLCIDNEGETLNRSIGLNSARIVQDGFKIGCIATELLYAQILDGSVPQNRLIPLLQDPTLSSNKK